MENNEPVHSKKLPEENQSVVSIIGIGYEARRIIDKLKTLDLPETDLYIFDACKEDFDGTSIPRNSSVASDLLCNDNHKKVTEPACCKVSLEDNGVLCKYLSCFIVCLDNPATEDYTKIFLQKVADQEIKAKLLIVTLPPSSEGTEKRKRSLDILTGLEGFVDAVIVVDNDSFPCNSLSETLEEGYIRASEIVKVLTCSLVKHCMLSFDFNSLSSFLHADSISKYVDYISLTGDLTGLKQKINELHTMLPAKYRTVDDISSMILLVKYNPHTEERILNSFLQDVVLGFMQNVNKEAEVNWGLYQDHSLEENIYRLDTFTKCR